ncbi:MAG: hypothetical protein KBF75_10025 [Saprospiraceae bacterium]|jgi:hypothetical protein|nr:hypothetical protein [Saprospiraceae bacterium]HQU96340.1 hypothetical protein [Saprospiraceae bacterium]
MSVVLMNVTFFNTAFSYADLGQARCTNRFNGFCKPLITSRKSIPHLRNAELHLTKSQQVEYQILGNILIRDYLNINTTKS